MKEETLRKMIRQQIKSSLNESPVKAAVGRTFGRVEKMAGVKMLKKALGQGSPNQQAAGLYQVVQSISGNNPTVGKMLARMIMKGGIAAAEPEAPVSENKMLDEAPQDWAGYSDKKPPVEQVLKVLERYIEDIEKLKRNPNHRTAAKELVKTLSRLSGFGNKSLEDIEKNVPLDENKALANRQAKVDNTQAMKMLKTALASKSATVQTDFVLDMINNLNLKDAAKQRLKMKIKQSLK